MKIDEVTIMKCIICRIKVSDEKEVCEECDGLMNMLYEKNPEDKELTLQIFREEDKRTDKNNVICKGESYD
jgi:ferredoxin